MMPAIAKRKWPGQYVFLELVSIRVAMRKFRHDPGQDPVELA